MAELIWDGKYDEHGKKRAPVRIELPFQTIETVNESVQDRQRALDLFTSGRDTEWRNRLIWGDKKYVLPSLLDEFAGKVDLIYIDPPFDTGADFSFTTTVPESDQNFVKQPSVLEHKAYRDTWGVSPDERQRGVSSVDKYLKWFSDTLLFLRDLLNERGSIYVHLDWHVGHYGKLVLDEVFGQDRYRNEIIWKATNAHSDAKRFGSIHQTIHFYTKSDEWTWHPQYDKYSDDYVKTYYRYKDPDGRQYASGDVAAAGPGPARRFRGKLIPRRVPTGASPKKR